MDRHNRSGPRLLSGAGLAVARRVPGSMARPDGSTRSLGDRPVPSAGLLRPLGGDAAHDRTRRHVLEDYGVRRDHRSVAKDHAAEDLRAGPDEHVVAHLRAPAGVVRQVGLLRTQRDIVVDDRVGADRLARSRSPTCAGSRGPARSRSRGRSPRRTPRSSSWRRASPPGGGDGGTGVGQPVQHHGHEPRRRQHPQEAEGPHPASLAPAKWSWRAASAFSSATRLMTSAPVPAVRDWPSPGRPRGAAGPPPTSANPRSPSSSATPGSNPVASRIASQVGIAVADVPQPELAGDLNRERPAEGPHQHLGHLPNAGGRRPSPR